MKGFVIGLAATLVLVGGLLFGGGFLRFVSTVSALESADSAQAGEAIVVLTGGNTRMEAGLNLLDGRKGQRLLISGVNRDVTREELRSLIAPELQAAFDCCVDLDMAARNTIGNARESARWVRTHGYQDVLVVTARYHMPRALAELHEVAPDIAWHAAAVSQRGVHLEDWWRWPGTAKLLVSEYLKFLAMQLRFRLEPSQE